jgi:hypothetical protein
MDNGQTRLSANVLRTDTLLPRRGCEDKQRAEKRGRVGVVLPDIETACGEINRECAVRARVVVQGARDRFSYVGKRTGRG